MYTIAVFLLYLCSTETLRMSGNPLNSTIPTEVGLMARLSESKFMCFVGLVFILKYAFFGIDCSLRMFPN